MGFIDWLVKRIKPVRFWDEKEWNDLTPKEKVWIFYKHHWTMKNQGSGEIDQITNPVKELILYGGIIYSSVAAYLIASGISFDPNVLLFQVEFGAVIYVIGNTIVQWLIGNWKDKKDLIALEQEIGNRRNNVFREMRNGKLNYKYKKKVVK